jgi:hypothetical protein
MTKDLDFTATVGTQQNETLQKLLAAWSSKNARAGKKVGTFGFMAATLAACGSSSGVTPQPGTNIPVSDFEGSVDSGVATISGVFAFLKNGEVFEASFNTETAKGGQLDTDGVETGEGVDVSTATSFVLSNGVTLVGVASDFNGVSVTGTGSLWLLVGDEATAPADNGALVLNVDITGDLFIDMPDDGNSVTLSGSVDLNGGKLIISDGVANAEGLTLQGIGGVEINSTLVLSPAQLKKLIEDGIEVSGGGDLMVVGVADDEEAAALFDLLISNSNLFKISGEFTVTDQAGISQVVDIESIINSKFEFLSSSLGKQIAELKVAIEGDGFNTSTLKSLAALSSAIDTLNGDEDAAGSVQKAIIDALGEEPTINEGTGRFIVLDLGDNQTVANAMA